VIDFGFNILELEVIEAFTHGENQNSLKLLSRAGFNLNPNRKDDDNEYNEIYELRR
jgi:ribosomal-protein-alanine N-acetyltransferase